MKSEGEEIQDWQKSMIDAGWSKATDYEINLIKRKHKLKTNKMNKEEFEKEFKVGDEITNEGWIATGEAPDKIAFIGKEDFCCITDEGYLHVRGFGCHNDVHWQKVEPVKKCWKHTYQKGTRIYIEIYVLEEKLYMDNEFYLKEPTEITLDKL